MGPRTSKPESPGLRTPEGDIRPDEVSDEILMDLFCRQNDSGAFEQLFKRYAPPVYGFLRRVVGSPSAAEDLLQATFLSVVRSRGRFRAGAKVRPWIFAIAANAARDALRRRKTGEELTPKGEIPESATEEPRLRDWRMEQAVQQALAQLPENQRTVIWMHRFQSLSFSDIAGSLGLTETAVKVRAHRGYVRLRALLSSLKKDA